MTQNLSQFGFIGAGQFRRDVNLIPSINKIHKFKGMQFSGNVSTLEGVVQQ